MDEKNPSSWDDLLNQIGVTPTSDADQRRRPAIETTFDPPPASPSAPKPKPKPSDWNALADNLGIEAPSEPERPAAAARPVTERPVAERPAAHAGPGAVEAGFASIEPLESAFEEIIEEEIADVEFAEADTDDDRLFDEDDSDLEAEDDDSDLSDASDFSDEDDELADQPSDELPPSTLSGEAARSAFEALFQAGTRGGSTPPRREQPPVDDIFGDAERPPRPPRPPRAERPRRVVDDVDDLSADRPSAGDEGDSSGEGQRPRRRRRRGGRGRDRDRNREGTARPSRGEDSARRPPDRDLDAGDDQWAESQEEGAAERETEESAGESSDRPRRRRSRRGRGGRGRTTGESREAAEERPAARNGRRPKKAVDEDDADEDDELAAIPVEGDDEGDEDDEGSSTRAVHKSIPSWSEAISVMVDTNMVSRKNSPGRPSSPRGGRGRGRSRGGRSGERGGGDRGGRSRG